MGSEKASVEVWEHIMGFSPLNRVTTHPIFVVWGFASD
jgi:hypothetical protein